jgi:carbamoyl-phosphate synthase small subunit
MRGTLVFQDGTKFASDSFGKSVSVSGELVFTTGMVGYPESLTDPSYAGQILIFTYPLLGNYGVPPRAEWESYRIHAAGVVVSEYIDTPSHHSSTMSLGKWLASQGVPALQIKDTRALAQKIRSEGSAPGKIVIGRGVPFADPNKRNLVDEVSVKEPFTEGKGRRTVFLIDCGAKDNIRRSLVERGTRVVTLPWNYPVFGPGGSAITGTDLPRFDGIVISNGPGDPRMADVTIANIRIAMKKKIPILGICLGNQILALAAGGATRKLKFGHRGQNQPARLVGTQKSYLTTQNHGFVVARVPRGFKEWFVNANDGTNEGLVHEKLPFMSVQFHPEANPGPLDTGWIFDHFLKRIKHINVKNG